MPTQSQFEPIVCVVGFHHARGPEVETWIGVQDGSDPASENDWPLLPFMALSDGAHSSIEDYSYFTLRHEATESQPVTSLFGISCTRQMDAADLIKRPPDVTRSTVQKAVVVICDTPQYFTSLREKLGFVTKAWFAQKDFSDLELLKDFQKSLARSFRDQDDERDQFFGLSLREIIHQFKWQTLVLFKCLLLQPKMLFFGSHCERLCMLQFSLISLIPGLIRNLQDCADPVFNSYEENFQPPTSLKSSDRSSLLSYVGLPLQIFSRGSLFGPYTPLQQLDMLTDNDTKSYVVGSTNSLLLAQKERYADILINLDENTITFPSPIVKAALTLTVPDRRWIDFLTQTVNDTWDDENPSRPKTLGYAGSEEFIRLQFEEYLLALLSTAKYKQFVEKSRDDAKSLVAENSGGDGVYPATDFGIEWMRAWQKTENYRIFDKFTDSHIFDIVDPNHPCTGGLTIEDVQRRLAAQVAELHLDERIRDGKEVLGKHLATGQRKVSTAFNNLWNDIEVMREAQRKNAAERRAAATFSASGERSHGDGSAKVNGRPFHATPNLRLPKAPDLNQAQATVQAAGIKAGAYLSSWGAWAAEKRKTGWGRNFSGESSKVEKGSAPVSPTSEKRKASSWVEIDRPKEKESNEDEAGIEMSPVSEKKSGILWDSQDLPKEGKELGKAKERTLENSHSAKDEIGVVQNTADKQSDQVENKPKEVSGGEEGEMQSVNL